jgi:hypothetical protein
MIRPNPFAGCRKGSNGRYTLVLLFSLTLGLQLLHAQDLLRSDFENSVLVDNPWAGVSTAGPLAVLPGKQPAVNDEGRVSGTDFGPSVAVGDLNGDGLQDLVIADPRGFFWYYPNSGSTFQPKFTHGEIMPIWLGAAWGDPLFLGEGGINNIIPKIQLVDLTGEGKLLSLIAGNYVGRLFYLPNRGTPQQPSFRMPRDRQELLVATRKNNVLWCNYLSPLLYNWYGAGNLTGNLDLILGDGSYSANSIFLLKNQGSRDKPTFNENAMVKIIPGMGREHLTPQVVDWNNDGKPDIIAGERTGHINIFLNTSTDPAQPTFDEGQSLRMGGSDTFGEFTTATVCDLTGNKLPNLIVTNSKGDIMYAQNTGKLGAPLFGAPVPIRGVNPFPKILRPNGWRLDSPAGVPHELLVCTNANIQPGFTPPPGTTLKSALRYYVYPIKNTYFNDFYYPLDDTSEFHKIVSERQVTMTEDASYKVSFWVRATGPIRDLHYKLKSWYRSPVDDKNEEVDMTSPVGAGGSWNQYEDTTNFRVNDKPNDGKKITMNFIFDVEFHGQGEVYLDDVEIRPAN